MVASQRTHIQREEPVLADLEASFPNFAGQALRWTKVPDRQDPPDFLSSGPNVRIGLELAEWLDGVQMGPAKGRESKREHARRVLAEEWEKECKPESFNGTSISLNENKRIVKTDEAPLRREFFDFSAEVDRTWQTHPDRVASSCNVTKFPNYPLMGKYFNSICYIGGKPHGLCWIDVEEDGGAYDPNVAVETLKQILDKKLKCYSTPEKQAHLLAYGLTELYLLVHGGFNAYFYNTPSAPLSLDDIARHGAGFYRSHPQRQIFNRVWFFDSLDSADELNQALGYSPGYGRVRWLAQLWPELTVYP